MWETIERDQRWLKDAAVNRDCELVRLWRDDDGHWFITVGHDTDVERFDVGLGVFAPNALKWVAERTRQQVRDAVQKPSWSVLVTRP